MYAAIVPDPSILSTHVAHRSVYTEPDRIFTIDDPTRVTTGAVVSIQFTVAVVEPVFPAASTKSNTNDPLALKVYVSEPELLVIVIDSLAHVRVATTDPLVVTDGEYSTVAVGVVVSIFATVAVAEPVLPAASTKSKVNDPFDENV